MRPVDWHQIFAVDVSPLEVFVRGTILYISIFLVMRLFRRGPGGVSLADMLLIVLVADAAQNGMTGDYKSATDGVILVGTLAFWNFAIDWLGYRVPSIERLIHPPPEPLIVKGQFKRHAMRQQLITTDELMSQLREKGVTSPEEVELAQLEGDGSISIVRRHHKDR